MAGPGLLEAAEATADPVDPAAPWAETVGPVDSAAPVVPAAPAVPVQSAPSVAVTVATAAAAASVVRGVRVDPAAPLPLVDRESVVLLAGPEATASTETEVPAVPGTRGTLTEVMVAPAVSVVTAARVTRRRREPVLMVGTVALVGRGRCVAVTAVPAAMGRPAQLD